MSEPKRSAADLVDELRHAARGLRSKSFAALAMTYGKKARFVVHDDPRAIEKIDAHIAAGALPIGIVVVERTRPEGGTVKIRTLDEYAGDKWAEKELLAIAGNVGRLTKSGLRLR